MAVFAQIAHEAGANGITIHPRPDERHIRASDVAELAGTIAGWRPEFELNVEGRPEPRLFELIETVKPEQCTLVPDAPSVFTSEKGWDLTPDEIAMLQPVIERLHRIDARVILFVDPAPDAVYRVADTGADGIEIYTGIYAASYRNGRYEQALDACVEAAQVARGSKLLINAGHDLNLENLRPLVAEIRDLAEVSIGHELTADALRMGFAAAIKAYLAALAPREAASVENR